MKSAIALNDSGNRSHPVVDANPAHLGQVVINLLMNAAQATPENADEGMRITLAMGTTEEGDAFIRVQDTGPGIPNDDLQRLRVLLHDQGRG